MQKDLISHYESVIDFLRDRFAKSIGMVEALKSLEELQSAEKAIFKLRSKP